MRQLKCVMTLLLTIAVVGPAEAQDEVRKHHADAETNSKIVGECDEDSVLKMAQLQMELVQTCQDETAATKTAGSCGRAMQLGKKISACKVKAQKLHNCPKGTSLQHNTSGDLKHYSCKKNKKFHGCPKGTYLLHNSSSGVRQYSCMKRCPEGASLKYIADLSSASQDNTRGDLKYYCEKNKTASIPPLGVTALTPQAPKAPQEE